MHTLALWCSFLLLPARFINNDKTNTSQLKLSRKIMMACLQKVMISGLHRVPIRKSSSFFFPSDPMAGTNQATSDAMTKLPAAAATKWMVTERHV